MAIVYWDIPTKKPTKPSASQVWQKDDELYAIAQLTAKDGSWFVIRFDNNILYCKQMTSEQIMSMEFVGYLYTVSISAVCPSNS